METRRSCISANDLLWRSHPGRNQYFNRGHPAIPLAGKVVAGPCMMAMPLFLLYRVLGPRSRTHGAGKIASGGDRYRHEDVSRMAGDAGRLVAQRQERRDWAFTAEPAAEESAVNKSLAKGPAKAKAMPGVLLFATPQTDQHYVAGTTNMQIPCRDHEPNQSPPTLASLGRLLIHSMQ